MSTSTWRGPTTDAMRASTVRTASSTSSASRSGLISPAWMRLRSSSPPTIRSSRLVSSSISDAVARTSSGERSYAGSASVPAAARIPASGVRRSCETESTSALLSAASRRATSAARAWRRSRSRPSATPTCAAASARRRVCARVGSGCSGRRVAHSAPMASPSASRRTLYRCSPAGRGTASIAAGPGAVRPHPGRLAAVGHQDLDHRRRGRDRPVARVGERPLGAALLDDAPDAVHAGARDQAPGDGRERRVRVVRRERARDRVERRGLGGAGLGLRRPVRADTREPPDDEGDEQEQHEVEPLGRVRDDEREPRLGEQEVVDDERRDRGDDAGRGAQPGGDDDHGDEVDRRAVDLTGDGLDDGDGDGRDRQHQRDEQRGAPDRPDRRACGGGRLRGDGCRDGHRTILVRGITRMR